MSFRHDENARILPIFSVGERVRHHGFTGEGSQLKTVVDVEFFRARDGVVYQSIWLLDDDFDPAKWMSPPMRNGSHYTMQTSNANPIEKL